MRKYAKHEQGEKCPGCEDRLKDLNPYLAEWFHFQKLTFPDMHCSWTFRDEESQNNLFASGLSRLQWPKSKHNYMRNGKPEAMAIDIFQIREDGKAVFDPVFCVKLWEWSKNQGYTYLRWGGEWKTFKDRDHFEIQDP